MTILCIDDDPATRALTVRTVGKAGYKVQSASNARAGLELAARIPDLVMIILDIHMPEINGYEALDLIRTFPALANVPVLMVTSTADPKGTREKGLSHGACDVVIQPVSDEALLEPVRKALGAAAGAESSTSSSPIPEDDQS